MYLPVGDVAFVADTFAVLLSRAFERATLEAFSMAAWCLFAWQQQLLQPLVLLVVVIVVLKQPPGLQSLVVPPLAVAFALDSLWFGEPFQSLLAFRRVTTEIGGLESPSIYLDPSASLCVHHHRYCCYAGSSDKMNGDDQNID